MWFRFVAVLWMGLMGLGWAMGNTLSNISFSPSSPASLDWGEWVTLTFDYQTGEPDGVRFDCYPLSSQNWTLDAGTSGSALYPMGTGQGEQAFTLLSGEDVVDCVIVRILDDTGSEILFETTIEGLAFSFPKQAGGAGAFPQCDETRILAHLTRDGSPFRSTVIVENFGSTAQAYRFTPYGQDGAQYSSHSGQVPPHSATYVDPEALFGTSIMSHFEISGDSKVMVSVAYEGQGQSTPVYVPEQCDQAKTWRILPGNWNTVFDGLAVVNMGQAPTDLVLHQQAQDGSRVQTTTVATGLASKAKALYVLDTDFSQIPDTQFILEATQPVVVVAIAGSRPGAPVSFLWVNAAFPLD